MLIFLKIKILLFFFFFFVSMKLKLVIRAREPYNGEHNCKTTHGKSVAFVAPSSDHRRNYTAKRARFSPIRSKLIQLKSLIIPIKLQTITNHHRTSLASHLHTKSGGSK